MFIKNGFIYHRPRIGYDFYHQDTHQRWITILTILVILILATLVWIVIDTNADVKRTCIWADSQIESIDTN